MFAKYEINKFHTKSNIPDHCFLDFIYLIFFLFLRNEFFLAVTSLFALGFHNNNCITISCNFTHKIILQPNISHQKFLCGSGHVYLINSITIPKNVYNFMDILIYNI